MARSLRVLFSLCTLILYTCYSEACLFSSSRSSSGGSSSSFPHDIDTKSGLTALYNKRVVYVDEYRRPLSGLPGMFWIVYHTGVVVTTADGEKWLIHKGKDYGLSYQTVIVSASCMSYKWEHTGGHSVSNAKVADYVEAGGKDYSIMSDNCQDARDRMLEID